MKLPINNSILIYLSPGAPKLCNITTFHCETELMQAKQGTKLKASFDRTPSSKSIPLWENL